MKKRSLDSPTSRTDIIFTLFSKFFPKNKILCYSPGHRSLTGDIVMKKFLAIGMVLTMVGFSLPVFSESGACDCVCLRAAIHDPSTDPDDLPLLEKAYLEYCGN